MDTIIGYCLSFAMTIMFFAANLEVQSVITKLQVGSEIAQEKERLEKLKKRLYCVTLVTIIYGCLFIAIAIIILVRSNFAISAGFWIPGGFGLIIFAAMMLVSGAKLSATNLEKYGQTLNKWSKALLIIASVIMVPGLILSTLMAANIVSF